MITCYNPTNDDWLAYYDDHALDIADEVLDYCDESFNPEDDLYFIYAAKMHFTLQEAGYVQ